MIWSARFAPDGKTVVFGGAWEGETGPDLLDEPGSPGGARAWAAGVGHSGDLPRRRDGGLARPEVPQRVGPDRAPSPMRPSRAASRGRSSRVWSGPTGAPTEPTWPWCRFEEGQDRLEFRSGSCSTQRPAGSATLVCRRAGTWSRSSTTRCSPTTAARLRWWTARASEKARRGAEERPGTGLVPRWQRGVVCRFGRGRGPLSPRGLPPGQTTAAGGGARGADPPGRRARRPRPFRARDLAGRHRGSGPG